MATSIYQTVFQNGVTKYTERYVPPAVTAAGLPTSQVAALIKASAEGASALKSYSPAVAAAAEAALGRAYCKAML